MQNNRAVASLLHHRPFFFLLLMLPVGTPVAIVWSESRWRHVSGKRSNRLLAHVIWFRVAIIGRDIALYELLSRRSCGIVQIFDDCT